MINPGRLSSLLYFLACFSPSVLTHQEKAAITQILLNERSGHLEIAHRFYIHDAEHAVKLITGNKLDIFASQEAGAAFYAYVTHHFDLFIKDQPVELAAIGFEIEGNFFWAYQEMLLTEPVQSIQVRHTSLQEFWPDQVNTLNFESGTGQVKTAVFEGTDGLTQLEF